MRKELSVIDKVRRELNRPKGYMKIISRLYDLKIVSSNQETVDSYLPEEERTAFFKKFIGTNQYNLRKIRKVRKEIRNALVEDINTYVESENSTYFKIVKLLLALEEISYDAEGMRGIKCKDNDKVKFCVKYIRILYQGQNWDMEELFEKDIALLKLLDS